MATTIEQKGYQKKYDKKTKMISVKYVISDMDDYNRLKKYLEQTGKSANSFIKELINDFFEHEKYVLTDKRIAGYYMDYNVDSELLDKLKNKVGDDRFKIIMDYYKSVIENELYFAYSDKGADFDGWIEQFLSDIESGDVNINVSDDEFWKIVDASISDNVGDLLSN